MMALRMMTGFGTVTGAGGVIGKALAAGFGFADAGGVLTIVLGVSFLGVSLGGSVLATVVFCGSAAFGSGMTGGFTFAATSTFAGSDAMGGVFVTFGMITGSVGLIPGAVMGFSVCVLRDGMASSLVDGALGPELSHQASMPKITTAAAAQTGQAD